MKRFDQIVFALKLGLDVGTNHGELSLECFDTLIGRIYVSLG